MDRVDADSETLNGQSNRHRQLLDDNLKWQRKAEELAGRHEQRIANLEKDLEEKEVYISSIECMQADLSGRVSKMEGKLCRCRDEEDVEVAEVEDAVVLNSFLIFLGEDLLKLNNFTHCFV